MPTNWSQEWTPTVKAAKPKTDVVAAKQKPKEIKLGVSEQTQINQATSQYDTGKALRQYQEESARRKLGQNLSSIDRANLDNLKAVGNDYAARGMMRSGSYLQRQTDVNTEAQLAKGEALQSQVDLQNLNQLEDASAQQQLDAFKQNIIQQYLAAVAAGKINKTGQI
jgi:hypothetical protein